MHQLAQKLTDAEATCDREEGVKAIKLGALEGNLGCATLLIHLLQQHPLALGSWQEREAWSFLAALSDVPEAWDVWRRKADWERAAAPCRSLAAPDAVIRAWRFVRDHLQWPGNGLPACSPSPPHTDILDPPVPILDPLSGETALPATGSKAFSTRDTPRKSKQVSVVRSKLFWPEDWGNYDDWRRKCKARLTQ